MEKQLLRKLRAMLAEAEAVLVGAGAGLSTSAGFTYSGERFTQWFRDFGDKYGFDDMYTGGFYPFPDADVTAPAKDAAPSTDPASPSFAEADDDGDLPF